MKSGELAPARLPARLRRRLGSIRRRALSAGAIWKRGLPSELEFWERYLATGGGQFPDGYRFRLDPRSAISDPLLLQAIDRTSADPVRILDVGAGPLTAIGKHDPRDPSRTIEIVATDPLAREYDVLLSRFDVTPPVRAQFCRGEELLREFGAGTFDIVHARNSIDHSEDPMMVIGQMAQVASSSGSLVLHHRRREAETLRYSALHQWNFDIESGRLLVWGKRRRFDVGQELGPRAKVNAEVERVGGQEWVRALITL